MFQLFRRFRWLYKKLRLRRLRYGIPLTVLAAYTVLGAYIFRHFELEIDEERRRKYRESTEYAFNQVLARMQEVRCEDKLVREDHNLQARHTKDALFWLIDYLNLTQVIEERSESSPWTWIGSMFYAGQLYTTIGYGLPACQTDAGRIATMAYIMVGIPIFLLILAEVGKWLSRALRKFYKRLRNAQQKLPEVEDMARKMSEPVKAIYSLTPSLLSNGGSNAAAIAKQKEAREADSTDLESGDQAKQKLAHELADLEPEKQNELNEKIQKKAGSFPIPMALGILILWILLSAGLFCIWETEWGYLTSVYFFFVSISTVGLGDIIPTKPDMMLVNFMLILVGLALLSMCINLIQEALERLIDQLIDEYIDEIEKIAAVVTNHEEFGDEATTPFEVGMTAEMLTVPLTSIAENNHKGGVWSFGRSVKDWMADRIATNVLMNRLDPHGSSDSSSSESDSEEEEEDIRLVESVTEPLVHAAATVSIVGEEGDKTYLPKISIHEGTPDSCVVYAAVIPPTKDSTPCTSRKSSSKKKRRGTLKHASMNPFANYSQSTMRAIQAIETGKMRAYRNNDFKSRLFAKFATNDRLAKMGQNTEPKKMVSCSMQTTPVASPLMQRQRNLRSAYATRINPLLESMDSTSSEVGPNGEWTSTSIFDVDSLCSAGYLDLSFGGYSTYSTDSVPRMLAESNTPQGTVKAQQIEQIRSRRFPTFGYGFAQKVVDETSGGPSCSSMPLPFPVSNGRSKTHSIMSGARRLGSASPPVVQGESLPPGSAVGTTPRISLTDVDSLTQSLIIKTPNTPAPTPTPTTSPTGNIKYSARHKPSSPGGVSQVPLLASIPLHHRALCSRRRFSANNCLAIPNENLGIKQTGETSGPPSAPVAGIVKCPSCHHFSSLIPPPVDTFTGCPHHHSPAGKPPSTKIYAKNSVGEIDWETIRRVRDACGLLPSDFLVHHSNEQTPKEAIKNGKVVEDTSVAEYSARNNSLLDDSGYSQSNAHSSPAFSVPSSPYVMSKDMNKEIKPENKEEVISISNVVVEDVLEEILQKICDLKDVPNES